MKIDIGLLLHDLNQMPALARAAEEMNFDGLWTFETAHPVKPFINLTLAGFVASLQNLTEALSHLSFHVLLLAL